MKALIFNNKVIDVQENEFEVHESFSWVDCDNNVKIGFSYDGSTFTSNNIEPTSEQKLELLRSLRNNKLSETDWTQSRDVVLANDAEWQIYRQNLRDITETYSSIDTVVWPEKPQTILEAV